MEFGKIIKTFKSKKGNEVVVRSIRPEDIDDLLAYANALIAEDTFILLNDKSITREEEEKYVTEAIAHIEKREKIHLVAT